MWSSHSLIINAVMCEMIVTQPVFAWKFCAILIMLSKRLVLNLSVQFLFRDK